MGRGGEVLDDDWASRAPSYGWTRTASGPRRSPGWTASPTWRSSTTSKNRPDRLGVSRCRLLRTDGLDMHVQGLDAVDGTSVLDIKPYLAEFGPLRPTDQPAWATELMRDHY